MHRSRHAQTFRLVLLSGALATAASAEVLITYESDIDVDPSTPDIIDLHTLETATITIMLTALGDEGDILAAGFRFAGTPVGEGANTVVVNGFLTVSDFLFADPMQDPNWWLTNNDLPDPATVAFLPAAGLPSPVTLATFEVTLADFGIVVQETGPLNIVDNGELPIILAEGSDSFTVNGIPEPTSAMLLVTATSMCAQRRTRHTRARRQSVLSEVRQSRFSSSRAPRGILLKPWQDASLRSA